MPNVRHTPEENRLRKQARFNAELFSNEKRLWRERWLREHPNNEYAPLAPLDLPTPFYIASMDEVKEGEIVDLQQAILDCRAYTLDPRGCDFYKRPLPWYVHRVRVGFYLYESPRDSRYTFLIIATRENLLREGYAERLRVWEEDAQAVAEHKDSVKTRSNP